MTASARPPLGQLLVDAGLLSPDGLAGVLRDQPKEGLRLGEMLVARGLVTNSQLTQLLSHQLALPWVSLAKVNVDPDLLALLPRELAVRHMVVPVYVRQEGARGVLYVATDDPTDEVALRECAAYTKRDVRPMVAATDDLRRAIDAWYSDGAPATPVAAPGPRRTLSTAGAMRVVVSVAPAAAEPGSAPPAISKPPRLPRYPTSEFEVVDPSEFELIEDEIAAALPVTPPVPIAPPPVLEPAAPQPEPAAPQPEPAAPQPEPAAPPPEPAADPVVLVVSAPLRFVRTCRAAAEEIGARVLSCDLAKAAHRARELSPFALVVTEDVYAFDRLGLSKLALEVDAVLVVWSDDLEAAYLEPLLDTAKKRSSARKPSPRPT